MKICIVGGTGNISTSIVQRLLELGHDVTCFNRGQMGALPTGTKSIVGDRTDTDNFIRTMRAQRFDAAIDMICYNAEQARVSLEAFRGVGQFVHCSTVCTYGVEYDWFPTTEDHRLRPISDYGRHKVAADHVFLEAYHRENFPVTIIKPSTTYGPRMGLLRQIAWEFTWIDRVQKGKPILVCGDGNALTQFLHVDDAALCFAGVLGKSRCLGQVYNMMRPDCVTWAQYHRTAMRVIGREVELVGVPAADLARAGVPNYSICQDIFQHHTFYSPAKLMRDVPEFTPRISLEQGIARVLEAMHREGRIPHCDTNDWEDRIIAAQQQAHQTSTITA